jgi:precorrin-2 dehydrogenase/sirohydrochlorin ferrochelatase
MLPLTLDLRRLRLILVGNGEAALRRLQWLDEAGAVELAVHADAPSDALVAVAGARLRNTLPSPQDLATAHLVFIADPGPADLMALADAARAAGAIVHVEDVADLTDLHAPAILRRGDLTIAVSTAGTSPALARQVKRFLAGIFGPEWEHRLSELAALRRRWRAGGANPPSVARLTDEWVDRAGWLETGLSRPSPSSGNVTGTARRTPPRSRH